MARPPTSSTAWRIVWGGMLSSRMASAPASRACPHLVEGVRLHLDAQAVGGAARRAAARRRPIPSGEAAMWLSLIRTPSKRPKRWLCPPPTRTAYFSR